METGIQIVYSDNTTERRRFSGNLKADELEKTVVKLIYDIMSPTAGKRIRSFTVYRGKCRAEFAQDLFKINQKR